MVTISFKDFFCITIQKICLESEQYYYDETMFT